MAGGSNSLAPTIKNNGLTDSHQSACSFMELGGALQVGYSPFEIIYAEFSQNTVRLPVGPAGDIVANSEKDGLNCLTSARRGGRCAGDRMLVSRTSGAAKSAASCVVR